MLPLSQITLIGGFYHKEISLPRSSHVAPNCMWWREKTRCT